MIKFFVWLFRGERRVTQLTPGERVMFLALKGITKDDRLCTSMKSPLDP